MNKKKPDHLYKKKGVWYIRYKDQKSSQWKGVSTGLPAVERNYQEAKKFRDLFLSELKETEKLEIKEGSIEDAFERFKEVNLNRAASTKSTYDYFYDYLSQHFDVKKPCIEMNKIKCEAFLSWLSTLDNLEQNSKYGIQKNLIKFLNFLFEYDYLPKPFRLNKDLRIKAQVKEPIIFTKKDRDLILKSLNKEEKNVNFKLLIYVLMYSGLRPSDIINLTAEQIDLKKMEFRFYSSKTDNWFVRPVHTKIKPVMKEILKNKKTGKLFNYSEVKNMGKAFQRYLEVIGLSEKGYDLRTFRKDFISRSQDAGVPINAAASLVGHSNIKTTMTYYTKLSSKFLKDELKKVS